MEFLIVKNDSILYWCLGICCVCVVVERSCHARMRNNDACLFLNCSRAFRVRISTAKFSVFTHLSLRWKPVNTCYTSTDSSKRNFQLFCEHYFLSFFFFFFFCRKHRSQNSSTVFAELDGESVTGVDCDGMVFDPNNFKAKREVIYVKWSFGDFFCQLTVDSYFVLSIIAGLFYPTTSLSIH